MLATAPLVLTNHTPIATRLVFGAFGLIPLIVPAYGLRPWDIPFGVIAALFWLIVLGAMALGAAIVALMIFVPEARLVVHEDHIILDRKSVFGKQKQTLPLSDIVDVTLERSTWQDGPDTFSLRITLSGQTGFVTDPIGSEQTGQAILADLQKRRTTF